MATLDKLPLAAAVSRAYGEANNAFVQKSAPDPVNGNLIEIGDSKQPDFYPQIKLKRWGNECNFSIRLVEWDNSPPTVETASNVVKYRKAAYEAQWFDLGFEDETGGHEHLVVLNQPPPTNQIQWTVRSKGLVFYPQPALTPEEIAEGCTRPDDIVDSIAVYHATKRNNFAGGKNYKNGKAFHLKRIVLTDANGQTAYGKQDITVDSATGDGLYTVTLPQKFLDSAVYPVTVDPTIGYTTHGGSGVSWGPSAIAGMSSPYTASSGDSVTGFTFYGSNSVGGANNVQMAAYTVVSSQPSARLAAGVAFTVGTSTAEYSSATVSQSLTAGTTYCVAMTATGASGTTTLAYDNGSAPGRFNSSNAGLLDPFGVSGTDSGRHYTWWATVTASGGTTFDASPSVGNNTNVGGSPGIGLERTFAASVGNVQNIGQVPTVSLVTPTYNVSPDVGNNIIQGLIPTIGLQVTAKPSVGNNLIVGQTPTVSIGNERTASPLVGNVQNAGQTPTIGQHKTYTPTVGNISNYGAQPTITWQLTILAATGINHIVGNVASITYGAVPVFSASPQTGTVLNYGQIPLIQRGIWTPAQVIISLWTPDADPASTWTAQAPASTTWS